MLQQEGQGEVSFCVFQKHFTYPETSSMEPDPLNIMDEKAENKFVNTLFCLICVYRPDICLLIICTTITDMLAGAAFPAAFLTRKSNPRCFMTAVAPEW